MNQKQTQEGYAGIYLERSGKDGLIMAETLVAPPELPLGEPQKQEALAFEGDICAHQLEVGLTIEEAIKAHKGDTTMAPSFFAEAFIRGQVKLPELPAGPPVFGSPNDVYRWIATCVHDSTIDEKVLMQMSKDSANYYKQVVAQSLVDGETPDPAVMENMPIVINPADMIKQSLSVAQARQFLHGMHVAHKEGVDRLEGAKRALTNVYLAKINKAVVNDVTILECLAKQSRLIGDEETEKAATDIVSEPLRRALDSDRPRTLKRLDYLRNGMGLDESGHGSTVDSEVLQENENNEVESEPEPPMFSLNQRDKMKAFKLSPAEMADLYSRILAKAGLLSQEDPSTWSLKRSHRAADDLFQVVINPSKNTFVTNARSGAYEVASEDRSLHDVILVGGFHELEHVNQAQIDRVLGKELKIAELKGKRVSMLRESGANYKQRDAEQMLFGERKPVALAYACALQVLEQGGDAFSATQAFYNEKRRTDPDAPPVKVAQEAADRVLRLTRSGGLSSQSMSYAEEKILDKELENASAEVKSRAVAITSLDLVDQVRLHKYELLPVLEGEKVDWTDIIMKEAEPYIIKALS